MRAREPASEEVRAREREARNRDEVRKQGVIGEVNACVRACVRK